MTTSFLPHEHIRRRADFQLVYDGGVKLSGRLMTMFARKTAGTGARLGIAATRKIGGAVVRNRAKRLTRELFRTHKPQAALDVVVVPRREFVDASYQTLEQEFERLLERVAQSVDTGARRPHARRPRRAAADSRV